MKKALQKIFSLFKKAGPSRKGKARKTTAQSLVEFAIALPILILLFAGVVEFGFILNYYLSILDATREAARRYSAGEPFLRDSNNLPNGDRMAFYADAADYARDLLDPLFDDPTYLGRRIPLDPAVDDVIVTVYSIEDSTIDQYPESGPYHLYGAVHFESLFDVNSILATRVAGAPKEGLLLVEVHYFYHQVLGLPYLTIFLSDPLPLHAYTIMPIRAAEPP